MKIQSRFSCTQKYRRPFLRRRKVWGYSQVSLDEKNERERRGRKETERRRA
jgi:hypothetical protein